jgi:hypothetical protein
MVGYADLGGVVLDFWGWNFYDYEWKYPSGKGMFA